MMPDRTKLFRRSEDFGLIDFAQGDEEMVSDPCVAELPDTTSPSVSYRHIVESSLDGIWTFDRNGLVTWENRRALELTRSRSGHRGMSYRELVEPTDGDCADRLVEGALSNRSRVCEARLRPNWLASVSAGPIVEGDAIQGCVWFARAVGGARTRAELEARSTELDVVTAIATPPASAVELPELLGRSLEAVMRVPGLAPAGGVFLVDEEGDELCLVAHRGLPVRFAETEGRVPLSSWMPRLSAATDESPVLLVSERDSLHAGNWGAEELAHLVLPLRAASGPRGAMLLYPTPDLRLDDELRALFAAIGRQLGNVIDSSKASLARQQRLRAEQIAMVSHDLRTPLVGILSQAELLRVRATKSNTDWCRQSAEMMLRVGRHMLGMVSDLLDSAKLEAGRARLELGEATPSALVASALEPLVPEWRERVTAYASSELPVLRVDQSHVCRVLTNLVTNALKYSAPDAPVLVRAWREGDEVRVSVEDKGVGIDAAALPFVFDPFFRTRDSGPDGVGLGLHIAKLVVEAHGGRIWASSEMGRGSTFVVAFPVPLPD
jgi:signal transduction histidine kinase